MTYQPTSGLTSEGLQREVGAARLSTQQRKNLDSSNFVFPDKAPGPGSCPIPDVEHARKALQLCSPRDVVLRKVCAKFPGMPVCKERD
jgi:hypothetical protein